jgi:hypothetical protein
MPGKNDGSGGRLLWLIVGTLVAGVGAVIVTLVTPLFSPAARVTATVRGPVQDQPGSEHVHVWFSNESKIISAENLHISMQATLVQNTTSNDSTILMAGGCTEKSVGTSDNFLIGNFDCSKLNPQQTVNFYLASSHNFTGLSLDVTYATGSLKASYRLQRAGCPGHTDTCLVAENN